MKKSIALTSTLFAAGIASALTTAEIQSRLENREMPDSLNVATKTSVETASGSQTIFSKMLTCGSDRLWLETQSPMGIQRVILNGDRMVTEDVASGKRQISPVGRESRPQPMKNPIGEILKVGRYSAPVRSGTFWKVELAESHDPNLKTRYFLYDDVKNRVVEMEDSFNFGNTVRTRFTYCDDCTLLNKLQKMEITTQGNGPTVKTTVEFTKFERLRSVSQKLFEIRP